MYHVLDQVNEVFILVWVPRHTRRRFNVLEIFALVPWASPQGVVQPFIEPAIPFRELFYALFFGAFEKDIVPISIIEKAQGISNTEHVALFRVRLIHRFVPWAQVLHKINEGIARG
jgi:hypothetical protein